MLAGVCAEPHAPVAANWKPPLPIAMDFVVPVQLDNDGDIGHIRTARSLTTGWLMLHQVSADVQDDVQTVLSELLTNVRLHTYSPYARVQLTITGSELHLSVEDRGQPREPEATPRRLDVDEKTDFGRGLTIVGLLAKQWGTRRHPADLGYLVYCALDLAS